MNLSEQSVKEDIYRWVREFVSRPNVKLGGLAPCPFALDAFEKGQVDLQVNLDKSPEETKKKLEACAQKIIDNQYEVAMVIHKEIENWPLIEVKDFVAEWRSQYQEKDLYLLKDHPEDKEIVSGIQMNQGQYLIFFVQRASSLLEMRKKLWDQGYYDSWSKEERQRVFGRLPLNK